VEFFAVSLLFLVGAVVVKIGHVVSLATARTALRIWLLEEHLVLQGDRVATGHPFTFIECGGRLVLRFEAMDRDGTTWRGWACVGAWDEPALLQLAWDEPPPTWGFRPLVLAPGSALGAVRRLRAAAYFRTFGRRAPLADSSPRPWAETPADEPDAECAPLLGAVRRLRASGHRRRTA
jgi:hypothetical protein